MTIPNMFTAPAGAPEAPQGDGESVQKPDTNPAEAPDTPEGDPKEKQEDWKARSREWERKAKANKAAADELAKVKQEQMSAEERAAERERQAEDRAAQAEARALRREVALDFGLSREDAELLDELTDETAIRRMAERLAPPKNTTDDPDPNKVTRRQKPRQDPPATEDAQARKVARQVFGGSRN